MAVACGAGDPATSTGDAEPTPAGGGGHAGTSTAGATASASGGSANAGSSAAGTGELPTNGGSDGAAPSGGAATFGGNAAAGTPSGGSAGQSGVGRPQNPILEGYHADPQIAVFNGKFYLYPTNDGFADWMTPKLNAFSSSDLVTWKDEGVVLDLGPDIAWADNQAWAPGIALKDGTYYFYFSAALQIGVATAKSPTGPFKDALGHPLVSKGQYGGQSIDPYAFTDDDGRSYLYFGSGSSAHVGELNPDMTSFKGTPLSFKIGAFREGSAMIKRGSTYYFMWSEDDTRSADYHVSYATGTSPLGPFTLGKNNPILSKDTARGILATGHHSVLKLDNGDYYIAYHRFAIPNGDGTHREVCLDRLEFDANGAILPVKPTR